jgi:hypothetical protein
MEEFEALKLEEKETQLYPEATGFEVLASEGTPVSQGRKDGNSSPAARISGGCPGSYRSYRRHRFAA